MPYATKAALLARFSERELAELTDSIAHTSIDDTALDVASGFADQMIDSKLRGRYSLPLATVPQILVDLACDITRYRLYGDAVPELVEGRYREALAYLTDLALGRATLEVVNVPTPGMPQYAAAERVFTTETLADY